MKNYKILSSSVISISFMIIAFLFLPLEKTAHAQESTPTALPPGTWKGEVAGKVANLTRGGAVPNKLNLMLHGYGPDQQEVLMLDGTTSPDGSFQFKDVNFDPAVTYGVMTSYKDITYFSEPGKVNTGETKLDINLPLYETTTDLSKVEADQAHLLFSFDQGKLAVMQVYVLLNKGDKTVSKSVTLPSGRTGTLKFTLPEEASHVEFPSQSSQRFIQVAGGFVDTEPLLPGSMASQVLVRYQLPYQEGMAFAYTAPISVKSLTILYPKDSGIQLGSSALTEAGTRTSNDGKSFSVLAASGLESGKTLQITVSGKAGNASAGQGLKTKFGSGGNLEVVAGASVLGLALVGVGIWGWRKNKQEDDTATTRGRYQRMAPLYDLMERLPERRYLPWRKRIWSLVKGERVLEVGVGTGRNMAFYPQGLQITAIDLTPGMLERARKHASELHVAVILRLGDIQALDFPDNSFDAAVATFVFCSVPDPVLGFRELMRIVKPGGQVLILEHMRSANKLLGILMDAVNPMVVRMMGANINRRTVQNVQKSGLTIEKVEELGGGDVFKLIQARVDK